MNISNFKKIGEYYALDADPSYEEYIGRQKSKKLSIVYLMVVNNEILYIGESRRGYSRPLSYHKNNIMKNQKDGITKELNNGNKVEVFALEIPNQEIQINGEKVDCYLAQDYEKFLIKKYSPQWNGRA